MQPPQRRKHQQNMKHSKKNFDAFSQFGGVETAPKHTHFLVLQPTTVNNTPGNILRNSAFDKLQNKLLLCSSYLGHYLRFIVFRNISILGRYQRYWDFPLYCDNSNITNNDREKQRWGKNASRSAIQYI